MNRDSVLRDVLKALTEIEQTWKLSSSDLSSLLHVPEETYSQWKLKGTVELSDATTGVFDRILDFLDFYDDVSSLFKTVEDQIGFLNAESSDFQFKSPLELIKLKFENILGLQCFISRLRK
jgi:hypothetical protein